MAITSLEVTQISDTAWRFVVASDLPSPTFYVYVYGLIYMTTKQTSFVISLSIGEEMDVEVFDRSESLDPPSVAHPPTMILTWAPVPGAERFRVDEGAVADPDIDDDADWIERQTFLASGGRERWESRVLEDDTTHHFRVTPIDSGGIRGAAIQFSSLMVRRPQGADIDAELTPSTGALVING